MNLFKVDPRKLHPTQFCLGFKEVTHKIKIIKRMNKKEFNNYLIEKATPVVKGPKNQLYLIDHHHHAKSVILSKKPHILVYIIADYSDLTMESFIKKMINNGYCNLLDENNAKKDFHELPNSILKLKHDLFRSLAWGVREKNGFKKVDEIPFFEFRWGEFFRKYIKDSLIKDSFKIAVSTGVSLAKSKNAKHLPGYLG